MTPIKSRKEVRLENKKNKLIALAEIVKLNDKDRFQKICKESVNNSIKSDLKMTETTECEKIDSVEPAVKRRKTETASSTDDSTETTSTQSLDDEESKIVNENDLVKQTKKELKERSRLYHVAKLRLGEFGEKASLEINHEQRTPLFLADIQNLLMTALIGSTTPFTPNRWCIIERPKKISHTAVLVIDGISLHHFLSHESILSKTTQICNLKLEILRPALKDYSLLYDLVQVPLTNCQQKELFEKYGSLEIAFKMNKDPTLMASTIFSVEKSIEQNLDTVAANGIENVATRTKLLLSALQMVVEGIPLPLRGELAARFKDFVLTKDVYKPVSDESPMFAVDCEMCKTSGGVSELTRISVVNEKHESVYESLVRPSNKIVDYLTKFSGITPEMMLTVTKTLPEVQKELKKILPPDAILIGHSINSDLIAMKMMHPYVIDTSVVFNLSGSRRHKSKLQTLAKVYLNELIQTSADGHDSIEDSTTSMKLIQLKLGKEIEFGDAVLTLGKQIELSNDKIVNNMFAHANKATSIISSKPIDEHFKNLITGTNNKGEGDQHNSITFYETKKNSDVIKKCQEVLVDQALTIANIHIESKHLQLGRIEKTLKKIDESIAAIWDSLTHNGMLLVLFGGTGDSPNGAVLLNIKRDFTKMTERHAIPPEI